MEIIQHCKWTDCPKPEERKQLFKRNQAPVTIYINNFDMVSFRHKASKEAAAIAKLYPQEGIALDFGYSVCHWRDVFCRKVGINIAKKRVTTTLFFVKNYYAAIRYDGFGEMRVTLESENKQHLLDFELRSNKDHPFLILYKVDGYEPVHWYGLPATPTPMPTK